MPEKISYIPSRLKNAAKGGHVAGAVDIIDDSLQLTQSEINSIVLENTISTELNVSPNIVFVNMQNTINLTATISLPANITIKQGETQIITGSGTSLSGSYTFTPNTSGNTQFKASFTIGELTKESTKNVTSVYPIKYGAGLSYTNALSQASIRTAPAGTYTITVPSNEQYVFFVVPRTMNINGAKMNGFDFPLESPVNVVIDNINYKYYKSSNTYDAGTLTIVIS